MSRASTASLTEVTYFRMRAHILSAEARPGEKLKIADLAGSMEASPSVVREALSRLVSEGLVIAEPQRGFRVAPLELSEVRHLFDARINIECACMADAIQHADIGWEGRIVAALHELSRTAEERGQRGDNVSDGWLTAHANFHQALVSSCSNAWFLKIRANLYMHSERFRALALVTQATERDVHSEHADLARAAIDRDVQAACAMITLHLRHTVEELWGRESHVVQSAVPDGRSYVDHGVASSDKKVIVT